jgi:hypothetical protein
MGAADTLFGKGLLRAVTKGGEEQSVTRPATSLSAAARGSIMADARPVGPIAFREYQNRSVTGRGRGTGLTQGLETAAFAVAIGYTIAFVVLAVARMLYPFELGWSESAMYSMALRRMHGAPLYVVPSIFDGACCLYPEDHFVDRDELRRFYEELPLPAVHSPFLRRVHHVHVSGSIFVRRS